MRTRLIAGRNVQHQYGRHRPIEGNVRKRRKYETEGVARGQAQVLMGVYGELKNPPAQQAADTGQSPRACRNQQRALNCMSLTEFFNACHAIPELQAWGARMMGLQATHDPSFDDEIRRDWPRVKEMMAERRQ